jgi:hypothetical protein
VDRREAVIVIPKVRMVICTPTKTGTEALLSALVRRGGVGEKVMPKHRISVPEDYKQWKGMDKWRRVLVVRNPWHRLVSMYYFLRKGNSSWGKGNYISFAEFCEFHQDRAKSKPSVDWTWNFSSIADAFEPDLIWRNETLDADVQRELVKLRGLDVPHLTVVNTTTDRRPMSYEAHFMKRRVRDLVAPWCEPDAERFGYEKL